MTPPYRTAEPPREREVVHPPPIAPEDFDLGDLVAAFVAGVMLRKALLLLLLEVSR